MKVMKKWDHGFSGEISNFCRVLGQLIEFFEIFAEPMSQIPNNAIHFYFIEAIVGC